MSRLEQYPTQRSFRENVEGIKMNCNLAATLKTLCHSILVIGYGNELRGDDGVGQQVARTVEAWGVPNLRSLAVHQLTPELTEALVTADCVIFVDAYPASPEHGVQVCRIEPTNSVKTMGHTSDPQMLLAIAQALYSYYPQAWWIGIPAVNMELGEQFSPLTEQGMADALDEIDRLIRHKPLDFPKAI